MLKEDIDRSLDNLLSMSDEQLGSHFKSLFCEFPDSVLGRFARILASQARSEDKVETTYHSGAWALRIALLGDKPS